MNLTRLTLALAAAGFITTVFTACSQNDNTEQPPPPVVVVPPAPTTADVKTIVLDGPLANATVCMDKNSNGACDADEPSARTAADGTATLKVLNADVGKYGLLAIVGTDAVDAVSGPVTTAYSLRTPADQATVISPLTTLVKAQMEFAGSTSAVADKALQDAANLQASMFTDFSKSGDASGLAPLARLLVLTTQGANAATAPLTATETKDVTGTVITKADVNRAIDSLQANNLADLVTLANSDAVAMATTPAAKEAALKAAASDLVAGASDLTPAAMKTLVAAARPISEPVTNTTATDTAAMTWFTYTDANNWYFRYLSASAAQNTPDANGKTRFIDNRKRAANGTVLRWGDDAAFTNADAAFDGTAWAVCPTSFVHTSTPRDAQGRGTYAYCNTSEGTSVRLNRDVAGALMSDVVAEIRANPFSTTAGKYPNWGPTPSSLGNERFPANSFLLYQTTTTNKTSDSYSTLDSNVVQLYNAAVAAGGAAATDECQKVTGSNFGQYQFTPTMLEQLVSTYAGKPCTFTASATTGTRNEWWSNSTINLGTIDGPAPALPYYRASRSLRVAFSGGTGVKYFNCAVRTSDGSIRNCDAAGTGTFSIESVGDARVMRFTNLPANTNGLTYKRIFVERGGKLYSGFRNKLGVDSQVRLNKEAMEALLTQLSLTR
jgi:trimeric autotransporter adhesin